MLVFRLPARFPLRFVVALLLGALHAASFIDDTTWPLEIATLAGLCALVGRAAREAAGPGGARLAARGGAVAGFGFGLGWFVVGVSWIYISLHTYGEMPAPIAGAAVLLFCGYLALFPAAVGAAYAVVRHRAADVARPVPVAIAAFAGLWTLGEVARGYLFTGFPWLASGYAHIGGPLAGYAPLVGVYGVSLVAAAVAAALAVAAVRVRADRALVVAVLFGLPLAGVALARIDWTEPSGAPIAVRLLQGNVAQDVKFDESRFEETSDAYLDAIDAQRADLIVLPETAFPVFVDELPVAIGRRLARDARDRREAIAFGIAVNEGRGRYFNSVLALQAAAQATTAAGSAADDDPFAGIRSQRYDKQHIVPFGEFIPTGFHWFVDLMRMPLGDFTRGAATQRPMTIADRKVAFNICYEDLFGEEIIRQLPEAEILVNVSNVAWFGDSMALPQHLDISRMRSIETGRPMLRATNTGMTAAIDPHGRVVARLAPFTKGSLDVSVQGMRGTTPFIAAGNMSAIVLALVLVAVAAVPTRRRRGAVAVR